MKLEKAYHILGVTADDDIHIVKHRYHRLMSRHHPDLVQTAHPEMQKKHIEKAQLINDAYTTIRESFLNGTGSDRKNGSGKNNGSGNVFSKKGHWKAPVNEHAPCERDIFISGGEYKGHKLDRYLAASGKYFWNPDAEEFDMLLYSLNLAAGRLLDQIEHMNDFEYNESFSGQRSKYQLDIFHLLSRIFIDPLWCLRKIAAPYPAAHEIYRFRARISFQELPLKSGAFANKTGRSLSKSSWASILEEGMRLYPASLKDNRLYVKTKNSRIPGYLSFEDDRLYVLLIPLMREKKVKIKMEIQSAEYAGRAQFPDVCVDLFIYIKDSVSDAKDDSVYMKKLNDRLERKLREYESYIQ